MCKRSERETPRPLALTVFRTPLSGNPILLVMNSDSGALVTTIPIGRGNEVVKFDAARRRVYASSGVAGNIVVVQQNVDPRTGADTYIALEAVTTKPGAKTMDFDPLTGSLITLAPDGWYRAGVPGEGERGKKEREGLESDRRSEALGEGAGAASVTDRASRCAPSALGAAEGARI